MATIAPTFTGPIQVIGHRPGITTQAAAFATLVRRRFALSARTPRELIVPVVNPIIFALVIAPALAATVGRFRNGIDYMSFVALGTVGLLIPINALFAGIGVFVDRESGARRDLLAAPIHRPLLVLSNLSVALTTTGLQLVALIVAAVLRGAMFRTSPSGIFWFVGGATLLAIGMYGVAETLANRMTTQEEYVGALPAVAIVPYFFAGSLFPISSLPTALGTLAKFFPLTHALALMRYGLLDPHGYGLHDIWGMSSAPVMAVLSLGVLLVFAVGLTLLSIRVFGRAAVR
jgi:ABC-type multidrug transport system permease subunit